MPYRVLQAILILAAIAISIPALIQWEIWNGLDLLALILWLAALGAGLAEELNP